jgi:hypothetical protein
LDKSSHNRTPLVNALISLAADMSASTMICVPTSLDQETGEGLGAQAGETKLTEVIRAGGFKQVRRATEGPFNMVLEARA